MSKNSRRNHRQSPDPQNVAHTTPDTAAGDVRRRAVLRPGLALQRSLR